MVASVKLVSLVCFIPLLLQSERSSANAFGVISSSSNFVLKNTKWSHQSASTTRRPPRVGPWKSRLVVTTTTPHPRSDSCGGCLWAASGTDGHGTAGTNLDYLGTVRDAVRDAGGDDAWQGSIQALSDRFNMDDAESCLAEAFGWKAWANAPERTKKFHRPKVPDVTKVMEALHWLKDGPLELQDEQILLAIRKSPKTYLDAPKDSYSKALGTAPRKYRDNLQELIRLDPTVLEVTYNCDGEGCASECGRCWVSYENRLPPTTSSQS
jgi:hypothetical protein